MKGFPCYVFLFSLLIIGCNPATESPTKPSSDYLRFTGPTMGTNYTITCGPTQDTSLKAKVDQLLIDLNNELSTYIPSSTISRFNQRHESIKVEEHPYMAANLEASEAIYKRTDGYFDPTVMPLVNFWGFGYKEKKAVEMIDTSKIDSLRQYVGFDKIDWKDGYLKKEYQACQLDFSAIAKGYAVDELGKFLKLQGVNNYLIDIGGELAANGVNPDQGIWQVGINMPKREANLKDIVMTLPLNNKGMATSGNYRNFYEINGLIYGHTLNPLTGFPESEILSATVVADDCMTADGYATAFMAMPLKKALPLAESIEGLEAIFLYTNDKGAMTEASTTNIKQQIKRR